jgi:hypothetical protein
MQIRWRNIWLLSLLTAAVTLAALFASVISPTHQSQKQASVASEAAGRTLYVEVPSVPISDPWIYGPQGSKRETAPLSLPPREEAAIRKAAQQAAEDADAAVKH